MTFKEFLKNQKGRRGAIKDFIEDALADKRLPDGHDIRCYLFSRNACREATAAYEKLRKEYLKQGHAGGER